MTFHSKRNSRLLKQDVRMMSGQVLTNNDGIVGVCFAIRQYEYNSRQETMFVTSYSVIDRIVNGEFERETQVRVKFPQIPDPDHQIYYANVTKKDPVNDIVILIIRTDLQSKLPEEVHVADINSAKASFRKDPNEHRFVSFGYRQASDYRGEPVRGHISGDGVIENTRRFTLLTPYISEGMAGAPVLDWEHDLVVGMVTIPKNAGDSSEKTATAIDLLALEEARLLGKGARQILIEIANIRVHQRINISTESNRAANQMLTDLEPYLTSAPKLPEQSPVLREFMFERLVFDWNQEYHYVAGIIGAPGGGKTVLARQFVDHLYEQENPPEATFWWNFRAFPSISHFIEGALNYFLGVEESSRVRKDEGDIDEIEVLASIISSRRVLFILDGFEKMLSYEPETYGLIGEDRSRLKRFLDWFTILHEEHNSRCIILSHIPIVDLVARRAYYEYMLFPLNSSDSSKLLAYLRPSAPVEWQRRVHKVMSGHALSLVLTAGLVTKGNDDLDLIDKLPSLDGEIDENITKLLAHFHENHNVLNPDVVNLLMILSILRVPVRTQGIWTIWGETFPGHITNRVPQMTITRQLLKQHIIKETQDGKLLLHHLVDNYFFELLQQEHQDFYKRVREQTGRYFAQMMNRSDEPEGMLSTFNGEAIHHLGIEFENKKWLQSVTYDPNRRLIGRRYLLINEVGKGGFGIVYRAYDINTRRYRAVKLIEKSKTNIQTSSLEDEIKIISEIMQPNIIPVLDYSNDPKEFYIVMPLMEGGSLTSKIEKQRAQEIPFANEDIFKIIADIGTALDRVHNRDIIHRDVSPNNIIFNTDGDPYLIDFGLAEAIESQPGKEGAFARVGTRFYSANEAPSKRSDQYSLATIALEMLTLAEPKDVVSHIQRAEVGKLIDDTLHLPVLLKDRIKPTLEKALSIDAENRFDDIITFVKVLRENYNVSKMSGSDTDPFKLSETDPSVFDIDDEVDLLKTNIPAVMWSGELPPVPTPSPTAVPSISDTDIGSDQVLPGQSLDDTGIGPEFGQSATDSESGSSEVPVVKTDSSEVKVSHDAQAVEEDAVVPAIPASGGAGKSIWIGAGVVVAILLGIAMFVTNLDTIFPPATATATSDATNTPSGGTALVVPAEASSEVTEPVAEETEPIVVVASTEALAEIPSRTPTNTPVLPTLTPSNTPTPTPSHTPTDTAVLPTLTPSRTPTITPTPRRTDPVGDSIELLDESLVGVVIIRCDTLQEAYVILVDYETEFTEDAQEAIEEAIRDEGLNQGSVAEAKSRCDATSSGQIFDEFLQRNLSDFLDDLSESR